jgi:chromate transport protein ChrA
MSVCRLGQVAIRDMKQVLLAVGGALAVGLTPLGIVPTLLLAGSVGVALYGSRLWGIISALAIVVLSSVYFWGSEWVTIPAFSSPDIDRTVNSLSPGLWDIALFFFKFGAFTFGGGLTILAFMQDQVVNHLHWLTPQQFLDGLALGQLTPGPLLMLAAFDESRVTGYQPRSDRHDRRGGAAHAALCDIGPRRRNTVCGNRGGDGTLAPQSLAAHDRRCRHGACPARPNILTAPICGAAPRRHHAAQ